MSELLTREAVKEKLAARKPRIEQVLVPEWGGLVAVRALGATARDELDSHLATKPRLPDGSVDIRGYRALVVSLSVIDAAGAGDLMFTSADLSALGECDAATIEPVFEKALEISRMRKKDLESAEKNSVAGPQDSSPTA